jgi:hypothetical protein
MRQRCSPLSNCMHRRREKRVPNKTLPFFCPRRAVSRNLKIPGPFWVCARQRVAPQVVTVQLDEIEKAYRKRWRHAADNGCSRTRRCRRRWRASACAPPRSVSTATSAPYANHGGKVAALRVAAFVLLLSAGTRQALRKASSSSFTSLACPNLRQPPSPFGQVSSVAYRGDA